MNDGKKKTVREEILDFINKHIESHDCLPTQAEIAVALGKTRQHIKYEFDRNEEIFNKFAEYKKRYFTK